MENCDPNIYKNGVSVGWLSGRSEFVERYVKALATLSGQPVDWHYIGGRANILTIGDTNRIKELIQANPPQGECYQLWD